MSFATTRVILGAELLALRHRLTKRGPARLAVLGVFLALAAVFVGGAAFTVGATAGHFLPSARDPILAGGFTTLSVLMLVIGFPTVIATFFVGRDLLQLVLAPIRPIEIFAARLLLAMSANLLISAILLAGTFGVGVGSGASPAYFGLALLLIFTQVLMITAAQAVLMSLIVRWVPARLARDVAAAAAGLAGAGFYLAWNLNLRQSFSPRSRPGLASLSGLVQHVEWLPSAWPGHALSSFIAGDVAGALAWSAFTLALGAIVVSVAQLLYSRTLLAGLGVFGGTQSVFSRAGRQQPEASARRGASSPARAIAIKDWLGYRRDIRRLSRLVPALLFPIGYAFSFIRPGRGFNGFWSVVFLGAFIAMFMSTSLATPSIPSERRGFQLLRMAPMTMWQVIRAKVNLTLPPVLGLTILFTIVVAVLTGSSVAQIAELVALVLWLSLGFVSIGVSTGAIDPRFEATDDRRAVGVVGSLAGLGGALGFATLSLGAFALFIFGAAAATGSARLGPIPSTPIVGALMALGGVLLTAGATTLVVVILWFANRRLSSNEGMIASP